MTANMAPAPKADLAGVSGRMQQAIEDQLAALSSSVADCLESARKADPNQDFHFRTHEREDAIKIVSVTAELLQAVARIRGQFQHNYSINRAGEGKSKPKLKLGWSGDEADLLNQAEYDALDEWEKEDYTAWVNGEPSPWSRWRPTSQDSKPVRYDELRALEKEIRVLKAALMPPLPFRKARFEYRWRKSLRKSPIPRLRRGGGGEGSPAIATV